jgi:hypothetical protein
MSGPPGNDAAQQTLVEHELLGYLVEGLRTTLAWQVQGCDFTRKLSTLRFMAQCFQRHLERMMALEESDGYIGLAGATSPWLGRRVDTLRQEHSQLREAARRVVHGFEHALPTDQSEFASLCEAVAALLLQVEEHTRNEVALVQEAFSLIRCCVSSTGSCRRITSKRPARPRRLRTGSPLSNHAVALSACASGRGSWPSSARRSTWAAPRQKLAKALSATSSSSAADRARPVRFGRARWTSCWK